MSSLSNNKQLMIHVVSEIAVLAGITFYFTKKNNTMSTRIDDLVQRVEEQEDLIQKHDAIIQKLVGYINRQNAHQKQSSVEKSTPVQSQERSVEKSTPVQSQERSVEKSTPVQSQERSVEQSTPVQSPEISTPVQSPESPKVKVTFSGISSEDDIDADISSEEDLDADISEDDDDLDADIIIELADLIDDEINLKKEPQIMKDA